MMLLALSSAPCFELFSAAPVIHKGSHLRYNHEIWNVYYECGIFVVARAMYPRGISRVMHDVPERRELITTF